MESGRVGHPEKEAGDSRKRRQFGGKTAHQTAQQRGEQAQSPTKAALVARFVTFREGTHWLCQPTRLASWRLRARYASTSQEAKSWLFPTR